MTNTLNDTAFDLIFRTARSYNGWQDKEVSDALLEQVYDLCKMAPTSANCSPLRISFVKTAEAKEKLRPCLMEGNVDKTISAPVTAIFAYDTQFYDHLPELFPHADARAWFAGNDALIEETAFRNSTLQCAYFMLAARGLGLDCGPMSGFDQKACNKAFFPEGRFKSNFLCNLGYGEPESLFPRSPRPDFTQFCKIV